MKHLFSVIVILLVLAMPAYGQFRGNNLMEYQLGNIPDVDPADLSTLYNQSNLFYNYKGFEGFLRLEQFYSSDSAASNYVQPTQFYIQYKKDNLEIQVGNIYETLGRGLLFRTYEIKNSILEDRIYRQRKGFYRDLQGARVSYRKNWFEITALRGKVLDNQLPVENEFNRQDLVEAVQPKFSYKGQQLGLILLRHQTDFQQKSYASAFFEGALPFNLSYYGEYATALYSGGGVQNTGLNNDIYGAYIGLSYSYKGLGLSFELKDYSNLVLGTGFTSPPTLVKEHSYRVLNRSTHIPEITSEKGYQFEAYYFFKNGNLITINQAYAKNQLFRTFLFREYFAELAINQFSNVKVKVFGDYSTDEFAFEPQRIATGAYIDFLMANAKTLSIESEYQHVKRNLIGNEVFVNIYNGIIYKPNRKLSFNLQWELTTDPQLADDLSTENKEDIRHYLGAQVFYRLGHKNTLQLFAGQRRGGPACSSGVCYEVLDFEGVEFRLVTKF